MEASNEGKILNGEEAKVQFVEYSKEAFEFKLNVNKSLNSLDLSMVNMIIGQLKAWNSEPDSAPVVAMISGTGGKSFCAGGDVVSVHKSHNGVEGFPPSIKEQFFANEYLCDYSIT